MIFSKLLSRKTEAGWLVWSDCLDQNHVSILSWYCRDVSLNWSLWSCCNWSANSRLNLNLCLFSSVSTVVTASTDIEEIDWMPLCVIKLVSKAGEIQICLFSETLKNSLNQFSVWKTLALKKVRYKLVFSLKCWRTVGIHLVSGRH